MFWRRLSRSHRSHVVVAAVLVGLAFLAATLPTASVPAAPQGGQGGTRGASTFLDRVDVNVVNVEVFVTDGDGHRVDDLSKDDFEMQVDGAPVPISYFYVASEPRPAADDGASGEAAEQTAAGAETGDVEATSAGDGAAAEMADDGMADDGMADDGMASGGDAVIGEAAISVPTAPAAPRRPLFLVAYVDHVNILPSNRKRVLEQLRRMVRERVAAGDSVMLVGYDGSLEVVEPFSRNLEALEAGIDRMSKASSRRQLADIELRQALRDTSIQQGAQIPGAAASELSRYRQRRLDEAQGSYAALQTTLRGLAGLPGRKALIYVSDGIPAIAGGELTAFLSGGSPDLGGGIYDLSRVYQRVIEEANAHEITLYPLDARGSSPDHFSSAESPGALQFGVSADFEFTRNSNLREALFDMAEDTGGRAIINTFDFDTAFGELVDDFGTYYSLGFPSPVGGDGAYHKIDVTVKGHPGLNVRHRAGFVDKPPEDKIADRVSSFLLQGWESNPMGVQIQFGEPKKKKKRWRVPMLVRVPSGSVTLLPEGKQQVGKVLILLGVRDEKGRDSEITRLPQEISVPTEGEGAGGDLGFGVELEMRPGPASLVVGVWDEVGGGESYVFQKVVVGGAN